MRSAVLLAGKTGNHFGAATLHNRALHIIRKRGEDVKYKLTARSSGVDIGDYKPHELEPQLFESLAFQLEFFEGVVLINAMGL